MKQDTARAFWQKQLAAALSGRAGAMIENPAVIFRREAKAGAYDAYCDEEYEDILSETEQLSSVWNNERSVSAGSLILRALGMTAIDRAHLDALSEILSECSENSVYEPLEGAAPAGLPDAAGPAGEESWLPGPEEEAKGPAPAAPDEVPGLEELRASKRSPKDIYEYLDKRVIGQEQAKKIASMVMYSHLSGRRSSAVFCGPTGSGKTEIWRRLARAYPKRVRIVDASRLAADGWKGSVHLRDIFEGLPPVRLAKYGLVVVFDEADKMMCENRVSSSGMDYSAVVQNDLLKMMDGDVIEFGDEGPGKKAFSVDCSKISVVFLGAFEDLIEARSAARPAAMGFIRAEKEKASFSAADISAEDLIEAGMRREIAGRLQRIAALAPLGEEELSRILYECVLPDLAAESGRTVLLDEESAARLVEQTAESGLGARAMRSRLRNALDDMIFEDPSLENYFIHIPSEEKAA